MTPRVLAALALLLACAFAQAQPAPGLEVTVMFVGDIMLADTPGKVIARRRDPFAHFARLLSQADIRVGNLECSVARSGHPEPDKPYTFRAHPRTLRTLARHFDAVSVANNHSGDFGPQAFAETLAGLERHGIGVFGGGRTLAEAHEPWIVERRGMRIALLGYDEFFPRSFEADADRPGVAWSEDEQVVRDIRLARERHRADIVIPFMHWGWEHEPLAASRQRHLARLMIDAGADAVIGGHPHVVQDTETYRGRPIVYSLGNFVFDGFSDAQANTGWVLELAIGRQGVTRWKAREARIDHEGVPHPSTARPTCWTAGTDRPGLCIDD